MQIVVDLPERYLLDEKPESMAGRLKLYAALLMFRTGQLSAGAACEFAGVDRYTFLAACKQHGIPTTAFPAEELEAEVTWLSHRGSTSS